MNNPAISGDSRRSNGFFRKNWIITIIFGVVALSAILGMLNFSGILKKIQGDKTAGENGSEPIIASGDIIGGATPEETYDLFMDALKSKDFKLASRYFVTSKQESWEKTFIASEDKGITDKLIAEFEKARAGWLLKKEDDKSATYIYKVSSDISVNIIFVKGDKIWKIDNL
ncbi:MAG: hypothetical protein CEN90_349 [Parcubacteria group bacterium Licking1014_17]|nr:MAG: hypothetical protein CEN90_349 [Parcubacteria group bacterium Licking1014_17]